MTVDTERCARRALLEPLVDHAALFPPASVDPAGALAAGRRTGATEIAEVRRAFFHGYGSCSFAEPVEHLRALGLLPA